MIDPATGDGLAPIQLLGGRLDGARPAAPHPAPARRVVTFADPDGAYLAAAALRRYLDASVVSDAILIPTDRGPGLEIPADAAKLRLLRAIVLRFGGTIGPIE